jgi:hypothetical protein
VTIATDQALSRRRLNDLAASLTGCIPNSYSASTEAARDHNDRPGLESFGVI